MRRIMQRWAEEWERAVLWSALLALACLGILCWRGVPSSGDRLPTPAAVQRGAILGPDAYAFLASAPHDPSPGGGAFAFGFRPPTTPVLTKDSEKVTPEQTTLDAEEVARQVLDDKGQGGQRQQPPPAARQLRYLGIYVSTVGERLAAIEIRDPATGQAQTHFCRHDQVCEGLRLDAFDGDSLLLLAPGGTQTKVRRGAEQTFRLSPTVPQPE